MNNCKQMSLNYDLLFYSSIVTSTIAITVLIIFFTINYIVDSQNLNE